MTRIAFIILAALLVVHPAAGDEGASAPWRRAVGFGAGFEAGNGLHLGLSRGPNAARIGLGLIYADQNAEFSYSAGLRYLRTLYAGRINDTYAWIGSAIHGHYREGDEGFLASEGAGLGLALHLGLPFRLEIDSGWDLQYASQASGPGWTWGPTINGALIYAW